MRGCLPDVLQLLNGPELLPLPLLLLCWWPWWEDLSAPGQELKAARPTAAGRVSQRVGWCPKELQACSLQAPGGRINASIRDIRMLVLLLSARHEGPQGDELQEVYELRKDANASLRAALCMRDVEVQVLARLSSASAAASAPQQHNNRQTTSCVPNPKRQQVHSAA